MLTVFRRYGFWLIVNSLLIFPVLVYGQDLGSTNGLFRASNPAAKKTTPPSEKKSAPKTISTKRSAKNAPSRSVSKSKNVKTETGRTAAASRNRIPKPPANSSLQKSIVITVGKSGSLKTSAPKNDNSEAVFELLIEQGNTARDERNYRTSESAYQQAQKLKADDSRSIYGLGNIYSDQQRWVEAEKAYRQALELEPESPEANIALSYVLIQPIVGMELSARYTEAEKAARDAVRLDPQNAVAYDQLGVALELRGQIGDETQNAYRKAIEIDPNFALAYSHLARLLRRKGLNTQSTAAYQESIRLAADIPTMILVADVMQSQQRYAQSEELLRRALAGDPKNPTALFLLGRALTVGGNFQEAEKLLRKSVEISPNSLTSYTLLGSLYTRQSDFARTENILMQALRIVSENEKKRLSQEFEVLGDGLMRLGRKPEAARVYRQAISLDKEKGELNLKLSKAEKS